MINVCFIVSGLAYSGAEIVLDRFLESNKYINPIFIIIYKNSDVSNIFIDKYGKEKVVNLDLNHSKNVLRFLPWIDIKRVEKELHKIKLINEVDIIYANNTIESMLISKYIKNISLRKISHIHDMRSSIGTPIRKIVTYRCLEYYDKVIMVSNATAEDWNISNYEVVYNSLPNHYFTKNKKTYKEIKNISFIGTLSYRKGIDIILSKMDYFKLNNITVNIIFSSYEGKYRNMIYQIKDRYDNIRVYEKLNSDEIIEILDNTDLLVVPSRHDPLPTVIMEAMARGRIVIGNEKDGIPEMIDNKELVFNEESFINKIDDLLSMNEEKLNIISTQLYERAKDLFNENKKNERIKKIIN